MIQLTEDEKEFTDLMRDFAETLDEAYWAMAYKKYYEGSCTFVKNLMSGMRPQGISGMTHEDIAQSFWVDMLNKPEAISMATGLHRKLVSELRKADAEKRGGNAELVDYDEILWESDIFSNSDNSSSIAIYEQLCDTIEKVIKELPESARRVSAKFFVEQYSRSEIAEDEGVSQAYVGKVINETRDKIKRRLKCH